MGYDADMKMEAVRCMGAMVKNSERMIVLLDETYASRLWCVFELAAFLHVHPDSFLKHLFVCPVFAGQVKAALFLIMTGAAFSNALGMFIPQGMENIFTLVWILSSAIFSCCIFLVFLTFLRQNAKLKHQLLTFSVK